MDLTTIIIIVVLFILFDIVVILFIAKKRKKVSARLSKMVSQQWQKILALEDPKMQVLEGDKVIDRVLSEKGYTGTLGEKLKKIRGKEKVNLDHVWYFHKFRNRIAHEMNVSVSESERKRLLSYCKETIQNLGVKLK